MSGPDSPFETMVPAYERWADPATTEAVDIVIRRLGVHKGMRILDIGAGIGNFAVPASRLGAEVVAVDNASAMISRLRERLAPFPQSEAKLQDLHDISFGEPRYDATVSLFCVAFLPDARDLFARMVAGTRPGGTVAIVNWASTTGGAVNRLLEDALCALPETDRTRATSAGLDRFLDPAELKQALSRAGLDRVEAWTIDLKNPVPPPSTFLDELDTFFRVYPAYAQLSTNDKARLQPLIEAEFEKVPYIDGAYVLPAPANIAIGMVPPH